MKLLIVNHNDLEKGTFFRCFNLAKYLCRLSCDVTMTCLNDKKNLNLKETIELEGVKINLLIGQHGKTSLSELPFHIIRALLNVKLAISERYDFIYITAVGSPTTGLTVILLKGLGAVGITKARLIVDWDDLWGKGGLVSFNNQGKIIETVTTLFEKKIPLLAEKVTVASKMLGELAMKAGVDSNKIYFFPNGADTEIGSILEKYACRNKLMLPPNRRLVCFVGRATWTLTYLISCLKLVVQKRPDTLVLLISPLRECDVELIKKEGIFQNVIMLGTMGYEKMFSYLVASDILLLPRIANNIERANYPARLGDYLVAGRPIVATDIGDEAGKFIKEHGCGLLSKPGDINGFADNIMAFIDDAELADTFGTNNLNIAKSKLSWEIVVRGVYENIFCARMA